MFEAGLPSHTADSLNTVSANVWIGIVGNILAATSLVLRDYGNQALVDRVTVVRGYADLSVMYPNTAGYRVRLCASLLSLSDTLSAHGDSIFAGQLKSLNDRCRKFDSCAFTADSSPVVSVARSEIQSTAAIKTD